MVPVLVIRPEPGCSQTVAAAAAQQMDARGFALFTISARSWPVPAPSAYDAVVFGSANAARIAGPGLANLTALPAYALRHKPGHRPREMSYKYSGPQRIPAGTLRHKLPCRQA